MTVYVESPRTGRAEVYNCITEEHATSVYLKSGSRQFYHTSLMDMSGSKAESLAEYEAHVPEIATLH